MGEPEVAPGRSSSSAAESSGTLRRRRRGARSRSKLARARLRKVYFSLAAIWGFLIGTAAVLAGLAALGRPLHLAPVVAVVLVVAAVMAVGGGLIASIAYRDASRRLR